MQIGVFYFPTDYGIQPAELARALEERGYESLFFCEHTHIPTSRRSPYPGGGDLPKCYSHTHDPFIALSFAAAATRNLRIGTAVCLVPNMTRSCWPKALPAWISFPAAGSCSGSAPAGMPRRWKITVPASIPA